MPTDDPSPPRSERAHERLSDDHPADGVEDLAAAVRAARGGDEDGFRTLYRAVQPGLLRYLRVLGKRPGAVRTAAYRGLRTLASYLDQAGVTLSDASTLTDMR